MGRTSSALSSRASVKSPTSRSHPERDAVSSNSSSVTLPRWPSIKCRVILSATPVFVCPGDVHKTTLDLLAPHTDLLLPHLNTRPWACLPHTHTANSNLCSKRHISMMPCTKSALDVSFSRVHEGSDMRCFSSYTCTLLACFTPSASTCWLGLSVCCGGLWGASPVFKPQSRFFFSSFSKASKSLDSLFIHNANRVSCCLCELS